jgi:hypothetical protein
MPSTAEFAHIRQKIMAISVKKYGWNYDEFHDLMAKWGYGRSLRELDWFHLVKLRNELLEIQGYNGMTKFDAGGKYMWYLAKLAWPARTMSRLQHYWIKKYYKSHWNILNKSERRATINMLKNYIRKENNGNDRA